MNAPDPELIAVAEIAATQDMIDEQYEPHDDAWF
jgi:hypothetical protein